jgi:phosphoinositide-3-kinase, regulatory subunit 4
MLIHTLFRSTRPFLTATEKKWVVFQLLCALSQAHVAGLCHGDIKSENVLVTSWGWALLTDFASYKPTLLPLRNPGDVVFYFFDSGSRHGKAPCYIAPERFVDSKTVRRVCRVLECVTCVGVCSGRRRG